MSRRSSLSSGGSLISRPQSTCLAGHVHNMMRLGPSTILCTCLNSCDISSPKSNSFAPMGLLNNITDRRDEEGEDDEHQLSISTTEDEEYSESNGNEFNGNIIRGDSQNVASSKIDGISSFSVPSEPMVTKKQQEITSPKYTDTVCGYSLVCVDNNDNVGMKREQFCVTNTLAPSAPPPTSQKKKRVRRQTHNKCSISSVTIELTNCRYSVLRRLAKALKYHVIDEHATSEGIVIEMKHGESVSSVSALCTSAQLSPNHLPNANILWADTMISSTKLSQFANWQRFNHIPGMDILTTKYNLASTMGKMKRILPELFTFVPNTWSLRTEKQSFTKYMTSISNSLGDIGSLTTPNMNPGLLSGATTSLAMKSVNQRSKVFIMKPNSGSQGKGIIITKNPFGERVDVDNYIVQEYICRPLLIDERKFDLRIYVLVTSMFPFPSIFIYEDGLVRICTKRYERPSERNMRDTCAHLTNYSVNKRSDEFVFCQDPDGKGETGNKRSFKWFNLWLDEKLDDVALNDMHKFTGRKGAKIRRLKLQQDDEKKRCDCDDTERMKDEVLGSNSGEKPEKEERTHHHCQNFPYPEHEQISQRPSSTQLQHEPRRSAKLWSAIDDIVVKTLLAAQPHVTHKYKNIFPSQAKSASAMFDTVTYDIDGSGDCHPFTSCQLSSNTMDSDPGSTTSSVNTSSISHNEAGFTCFEILGFDILVDDKLRPWLIEVNHTPSFATDTPLDRRIKEGVLLETFQILNCQPKDKVRSIERENWFTKRRIFNNKKECRRTLSSTKQSTKRSASNVGCFCNVRDESQIDQLLHSPSRPPHWSLKDHLVGESRRCNGFRRIYPLCIEVLNQQKSCLISSTSVQPQCDSQEYSGVIPFQGTIGKGSIAVEVQFLNDLNRIERQITYDDIHVAAWNNFMQPVSMHSTASQEHRLSQMRVQRPMREADRKVLPSKCSTKVSQSLPRKNIPTPLMNKRRSLQIAVASKTTNDNIDNDISNDNNNISHIIHTCEQTSTVLLPLFSLQDSTSICTITNKSSSLKRRLVDEISKNRR